MAVWLSKLQFSVLSLDIASEAFSPSIIYFLVKLKLKIYFFTHTDSAIISMVKAKYFVKVTCYIVCDYMRAGTLY